MLPEFFVDLKAAKIHVTQPIRHIMLLPRIRLEAGRALDFRVPVEQGLGMFTALQRRGVESRLLYFPDEGHWVLKPRNSQLWYHTVLDWIDAHSKPGRSQ